jgi:hypothetical protein
MTSISSARARLLFAWDAELMDADAVGAVLAEPLLHAVIVSSARAARTALLVVLRIKVPSLR